MMGFIRCKPGETSRSGYSYPYTLLGKPGGELGAAKEGRTEKEKGPFCGTVRIFFLPPCQSCPRRVYVRATDCCGETSVVALVYSFERDERERERETNSSRLLSVASR